MAREFHYARMEPSDLREDLREIGIGVAEFARITGFRRSRVQNWLRDPSDKRFEDIPPVVPLVCELLKLPGAVALAEKTARFYLEEDSA